ncbi:MAG: MoxR family ATPase [Alphaproteobacteria bacterium]|nr:MoxR family ATPase [Alphaproteobacteria bacterium]
MSMNFEKATRFIDLCRKMTIEHNASIVPLLLGETGIGKTELVKEYCAQNQLDLIVIHVSQIEPADFTGLYKVNKFGKTDNCQPSWLPFMEGTTFKKLKEGNELSEEEIKTLLSGGVINEKGGIVFLDEVNRGHEDIRQAMYQLINERKMHTFTLPSNYTIVAAANPTNGYETQEFDKALVNRFAWVDFKPEVDESLDYLSRRDSKNSFIDFMKKNKEYVVVKSAEKDDSIEDLKIVSPRIVQQASIMFNVLKKMGEVDSNSKFFHECFKTILPKVVVSAFIQFMKKIQGAIELEYIFKGRWKEQVETYVKNQNIDIISILNDRLTTFFTTYEFHNPRTAEEDQMVENVVGYFSMIPSESLVAWTMAQTNVYWKFKIGGTISRKEVSDPSKAVKIINENALLKQPEFINQNSEAFKRMYSKIKKGKSLSNKAG